MNSINISQYHSFSTISSEFQLKDSQHHHVILKKLFPSFTSPKTSRFTEFFKDIKKLEQVKPNNQEQIDSTQTKVHKITKKKNFEINYERVLSGLEQRTSLMIKNLPMSFNKKKAKKFLANLVNLNYIYVPSADHGKRILGFSFINLCDYRDIISLSEKINYFNKYELKKHTSSNKVIEIYYFKSHGLESLVKTFGNHTNF